LSNSHFSFSENPSAGQMAVSFATTVAFKVLSNCEF
jgi:hypothetical protein